MRTDGHAATCPHTLTATVRLARLGYHGTAQGTARTVRKGESEPMTLLTQYYVPGLHIEDRSIRVPLDWTGHTPGEGFDGESISLFYRVVTAPEHVHDDLPLLVFLQGGPGGAGPRPLNPTSDGWIAEAVKHFRVMLPDQRGTGRSNRIDTHTMARLAPAAPKRRPRISSGSWPIRSSAISNTCAAPNSPARGGSRWARATADS